MQNAKTKKFNPPFWSNRYNIFLLATSLLFNVGIWALLYFKIKPHQVPIALHYNIYFGIDLIGQWYKVYMIPSLGLLFLGINLFLGYLLYNKEKLISYFLSGISLFSQILLLMASVCLITIQ